MAPYEKVLLPTDVVPEAYDLTLEPDFEKFTFEGTVKITCKVDVATDKIVVHTRELSISSAQFTPADGSGALQASEITLKPKENTCAFGFESFLPVGKGELEVKFSGILNDQMAGFYRSKYKDSKGVEKHMATTQFEAIDARRCFPCWDEPAHKAVFVITLIYPKDLMALCNMPPSQVLVRADGKRVESFMPSPKMSTYLLAFCIGEFEFISGQTKGGTLARVLACPGNLGKCEYSLSCALRALDFYNDYFGIPYPLPKVDMIAIPDFAAGAMENWGLVTYREVDLLCDEKTVSVAQKQRICTTVTHELAHQWFGNLVTMGWWDDLWLNEGFANWMETFAADKLHPEWCLWESYVGTEQQHALQLDALRSSHPIQVPIKHAEEVEEVFDAISYCKGGSVVRMVNAVLGQEKFQEGLRLYFKRHSYGNTVTTDLWKAWAEVSGKPIEQMMSSWTEQMGFPILEVLSDPLQSGSNEVEIEQRWFLADGSSEPGDEAKAWVAPVVIGSDKGQAPVAFLEAKRQQKVSCGGVGAGAAWMKVNFGQHVPCRVLYPTSMLERLSGSMQSLPVEDRIGLLADGYALCKAGAMEPAQLVKTLGGFTAEANDKVWAELSAVLGGLDKIIRQGLEAGTSTAYTGFVAKLVTPAFEKVGWEVQPGDDDNKKILRNILVNLLAKYCYKEPAIRAEALKFFEKFIAAPDDDSSLNADIRPAVLQIAISAEGTDAIFDKLVQAHGAVSDAAVRNHIYRAMGSAPNPALKKRALEMALSDKVRSQDLISIPGAMAGNGKEGAEAVFAWTRDSYAEIYGRLGTTSMILFQHVVRISGAGFVHSEKADEVEAFWKGKEVYKMVEKTLSQTLESIRSNSKFLERLAKSELAKPQAWQ